MKKNYRVTITDGKVLDSFTMLGESADDVRRICQICHLGTGWSVKKVELAMKKKKKKAVAAQPSLF